MANFRLYENEQEVIPGIFWLHHANIDRLWEVWRSLPGSIGLTDPGAATALLVSQWDSAVFWFGDEHSPATYTMADVEDLGSEKMGYSYESIEVPADLGERIEAALRQNALDRLGMEARAGNLINGSDRIETAARSGKVRLLLHAADAGEDGNRSLDQAWRVGGGEAQGMIFPEARTILSMALGRENVVHVALTDPAAASRVRHAVARWRAFTGPDRGLKGGGPALRTDSAEEDLTKE